MVSYMLVCPEKPILCMILLAVAAPAQTIQTQFAQLSPGIIQQRLEMVNRSLTRRKEALESLFDGVGCGAEHRSRNSQCGIRKMSMSCAL